MANINDQLLGEDIKKELLEDIFNKENLSLEEIIGIEIFNKIALLNKEYNKPQYSNPEKKGHFHLDDDGKRAIRQGYALLEGLREKTTGQTIFYINLKQKITKPFEFEVLTREGQISNRLSRGKSGFLMDKIPESTTELENQIDLNDKLSAQTIINNRLKYVQETYRSGNTKTYYTVYAEKTLSEDAEGISFAVDRKAINHKDSLLTIYNKYHKELGRSITATKRWGEFSHKSSYGYLDLERNIHYQDKDNAIGQLYAIRKINDQIYTTALGGKNRGHLLEAQLHAAALLYQGHKDETVETQYSNNKVISFDEAMIRASGNTEFYKGGDVTFDINGKYFTYQAKGIGGEVKINSIINGIKNLYNILYKYKNNEEYGAKDILDKTQINETLKSLYEMFTIKASEELDGLAIEMQNQIKKKTI